MMPASATKTLAAPPADPDGRVVLRGLGWWQYEAMLAIRGDEAGARLASLEGELEITSPSATHERVKKALARLLEAYAEERGLIFNGFGSLTMKNPAAERGAEPSATSSVVRARSRTWRSRSY